MLTVRLPGHLERELERLAASERTTKAQIVREALERYVAAHREQRSSFGVGEALFGRYGSGERTLSTTYEERVRACEASWLTLGR